MKRVRFTSAGMMLALATAAAGGILLVDVSYLKPRVESQRWSALRARATRAEQALRVVLHEEQRRLAGSAASAGSARSGDIARLSGGASPSACIGRLGRLVPPSEGVDVAWITAPGGRVLGVWRGAAPAGASAESAENVEELADLRGVEETGGLFRLSGVWTVVGSARVPGAAKDGRSPGRLWLGRHVDGRLLKRVGLAAGGRVFLVAADALPPAAVRGGASDHALWVDRDGTLVMACPLRGASGATAGYFRAELPIGAIGHLAASSRRTALIVLTLSVGVALLVVMGVHILVVGPVVRLLKRVDAVRKGESGPADLLKGLHGEPKMLAQELVDAFDRLGEISRTDELTGLANRRHFEQVLAALYHQAQRYHRPLSLMIVDIDFFKAINDTGGHPLGDEALRRVSDILRRACRQADLPARIGGDELCVILPETTAQEASAMAERFRQAVAREVVEANSVKMELAASIGITDLSAGQIDSPGEMLALADEALYSAKKGGRNRVVQARDLGGPSRGGDPAEPERIDSLRSKLAGLDDDLQAAVVGGMEALTAVLAERDPHRADHARKARHHARLLAQEMQLSPRVVKQIEMAAVLHDVGMAVLPDDVLLCRGPLDERQTAIMRRHPLLSVRIMEGMAFLEREVPTVRHHHERHDGTGYPDGLAGAAIPLPARILAVADAFAAMTSARPFRAARTRPEALEEIRRGAGTQFDPVVAKAFLALADRLDDEGPDRGAPAEVDQAAAPAAADPT